MKRSYLIVVVVFGAMLTASLLAAEAETGKTKPAAAPATEPPKSADGRLQRHCLMGQPAEGRFAIPESRVWPAEPGQADLCLWADDKLAAASITIDDNWAPDHPWWTDLGKKTGFKFTWFVITGRVGKGLWGTWDGFKKLKELGHDVQSHTVTHLHVDEPDWPGIDAEYAESAKTIQANVPGDEVICLAYPGGKNSKHNDPAVAAKYYVAGRSTVGAPNPVNRTNYMKTNSTSIRNEMVDKILDKAQLKRGKYGYYRAWLCSHYHGVHGGKTPEQKEASAKAIEKNIMYLKSKEADIWVGLFREVVLYGQERDTAKLAVTHADDTEVRFTLSDEMDDTAFDFPLTVKVRLNDAWSAVAATQGGKPVEAKVIDHAGGTFALVKAVPDRGEVSIKPAAAKP